MHALCTTISNQLALGPLVLVTIVTNSGSAPRTAGARMLVLPDGSIRGTIGGGRYEAEAITHSLELMESGGNARSLFFSLNKAGDMDMICGGDILVLLEHIEASDRNKNLFGKAALAELDGRSFAFVSQLNFSFNDLFLPNKDSPIHNGTVIRHFVLRGDDSPALPSRLGPDLASAWSAPAPFARLADGSAWLMEAFLPPERVHIFGGGHVSLALARLADSTGFLVNVLDDRADFVSEARFPQAKRINPPSLSEHNLDAYFAEARPDVRDALVIVTRGHAFDRDALASSLRTKAGYIGMIGSSSKRQQVYDSILQNGFTQDDLARVHSPIGVAIGADTPEEIAVSIMAELIQWRRGALDAR